MSPASPSSVFSSRPKNLSREQVVPRCHNIVTEETAYISARCPCFGRVSVNYPGSFPDRNPLGCAFHAAGEVLEWLIRPVSKTGKPQKGFVGSNPTLSANPLPFATAKPLREHPFAGPNARTEFTNAERPARRGPGKTRFLEHSAKCLKGLRCRDTWWRSETMRAGNQAMRRPRALRIESKQSGRRSSRDQRRSPLPPPVRFRRRLSSHGGRQLLRACPNRDSRALLLARSQ